MLTEQPRKAGLSLRRNFGWNLLGETSYSLGQWLLVVLLARLQSPQVVGEFALALGITAPIYLLVGLNLRVVQATDARGTWQLPEYLRLRHLLNLLAFSGSLIAGFIAGGDIAAVVAVVAAAKAAEAVSQTYYGFFQRCERLDLVARSLLLRVGVSTASFSVTLLVVPGLLPATLSLLAAWLLTLMAHDRRIARQMLAADLAATSSSTQEKPDKKSVLPLARLALPLGLSAGVSSLAVNLPRYLLLAVAGATTLGVFAALAYLSQAIATVTGAMGNSVVPRMAQHHRDSRVASFLSLVYILTGLGVAVTGGMLVVLSLWGGVIIEVILGREYVNQPLLLALVFGAGLSTIQRSLARGLQAAHRFIAFLSVDVVTLLSIAATGPWFISRWGATGAAWSLNVAYAVAVMTTGVLLAQTVRLMGDSVRPGEHLVGRQ